MPNCAVATCRNCNQNTKGKDIKFFPTICSILFENAFDVSLQHRMLHYGPKNSRYLKDTALPNINLPNQSEDHSRQGIENRRLRLAKRRRQHMVDQLLSVSQDQAGPSSSVSHCKNESTTEPSTLTKHCHESEISQGPIMNKEVDELRKEIEKLKIQNKELLKINEKNNKRIKEYENAFAKVFTPGQRKKLISTGNARVRWSSEDIAAAVSLRSVSPKAYRYLRTVSNYPLPAMFTLRGWVSNFDVSQGILKSVIMLMKKKSAQLTELDRICVLTFDEMYVSNKVDIDKKDQQVIDLHKACQTIMARGLISHWKQPVYYQFDQTMTKDILQNVISELYDANFIVIGITSDMGAGNVGLWSKLDVGHNKNCFFRHLCDESLKVFVFADVSHLIKLVRNHLIDQGFTIQDHIINVDYFSALLNISSSELTLAYRLTEQHINLTGSMRQKVRPAVQLLSNSVAKAIVYCGKRDLCLKIVTGTRHQTWLNCLTIGSI
nr:unnamed protein product [Callosobruchus analis]